MTKTSEMPRRGVSTWAGEKGARLSPSGPPPDRITAPSSTSSTAISAAIRMPSTLPLKSTRRMPHR